MQSNQIDFRINSSSLTLPQKVTIDLAEETGLHIGDGSMNFYKNNCCLRGLYSLRGHLIDDREHYDRFIKSLYISLYDLKLNLREMPMTGVYGFQKWSNDLVNFKHKFLGLPLGKKINIKIPKCLLKDINLSRSVVRGIFDTDGMVYLQPKYGRLYPRIEISTISKYLGIQLNQIINKLGIRATVYVVKKRYDGWLEQYKLSVRGVEMLDKWFRIISPHNPKHWRKYQQFIDRS